MSGRNWRKGARGNTLNTYMKFSNRQKPKQKQKNTFNALVCVCVCTMCTQMPTEEGVRSPESGVTEDRKLPNVNVRKRNRVLCQSSKNF